MASQVMAVGVGFFPWCWGPREEKHIKRLDSRTPGEYPCEGVYEVIEDTGLQPGGALLAADVNLRPMEDQ